MKKVFIAIGLIAALMAIFFVVTQIVGTIISLVAVFPSLMRQMAGGAFPDAARLTEELTRALGPYIPLIELIAVAVTVPIYYLIYHNRKQELLTFVSLRGLGAAGIPVLVIFGVSLNFLVEWLLSLVRQLTFMAPHFERYYEKMTNAVLGGDFIPSLLAVGIVGPIFEELLYRGLIFGELRKITKVRIALVIQAVPFGAMHLDVIQGSYAVIIGILLGYVYYRSNSIIAPIIVHISINASSVIMAHFLTGTELDQWTAVIMAAGALLFLATGAFILSSRNFKRTMDDSLYHMNRTPSFGPHLPPAA
ncbi:MAG: CPBP family intramembrane metalloprotease [Clostridiales bacterium]|jgi:membrane protease YdiL (CAAX protease family)|nr:CPBP family intramembrane metalloprotease [Clostridiales bacterium]